MGTDFGKTAVRAFETCLEAKIRVTLHSGDLVLWKQFYSPILGPPPVVVFPFVVQLSILGWRVSSPKNPKPCIAFASRLLCGSSEVNKAHVGVEVQIPSCAIRNPPPKPNTILTSSKLMFLPSEVN